MSRTRGALIALGLITTIWCAAWIPMRATFGAQVTADEPQYLLTALSLAEDFDLDISDELIEERWREFHTAELPTQTKQRDDGKRLSPHDPLFPLLLAPGMRIAGWQGAKFTIALLAGVLAAMTAWTAIHRLNIGLRTALIVVGAFSLGSPMLQYGTQVYPELPAALVTLIGVIALTGERSRGSYWILGASVVALPWLAIKYVLVAMTLAALGVARANRASHRSAAAWFALGLGAAGIIYLAAHQIIYDGWTVYASADHFEERGEFSVVGFHPNYLGRSRRWLGLFLDQDFGLAAWNPAWLGLFPALGVIAAKKDHILLAPLLVALSGWVTAVWIALTMHGWWWSGRQVVVVLPCVVLLIAWASERWRPLLIGTAIGGFMGFTFSAWLLVDGLQDRLTLVYKFATTRNPLFRAWHTILPDHRLMPDRAIATTVAWAALLLAITVVAYRSARSSEVSRK